MEGRPEHRYPHTEQPDRAGEREQANGEGVGGGKVGGENQQRPLMSDQLTGPGVGAEGGTVCSGVKRQQKVAEQTKAAGAHR